MPKELEINPRIIEHLAKATVKTIIDAIIELITNSDDSYKRLEQKGEKVVGEIVIYVNRKKGGICEKLIVEDHAEGMTKEDLEKAIEFAGETSGFEAGKSVRGFFGRGLKEAIIALGNGEITTVKDGKLCRTKIWFDKSKKKPFFDDNLINDIKNTSDGNGTKIEINITYDNYKIPEYEKFKECLSKHYALRDILSSGKREIWLNFEDLKKNRKLLKSKINFSYPQSKKVEEQEIEIDKFNDKIKVIIYESDLPLESPRNNPFGLAGILIKTKGAILDNQLFKFDAEPAALYFWGEAICNGIEERLRNGETGILDSNRNGLEWRHEYCQAISSTIEKILEPLILEKKKQLEKKPQKQMKESTKKLLEKLCSELNRLAKEELDELEIIPEPEPEFTSLVIKPEIANIEKDKPRCFSIYAPNDLVASEGMDVTILSNSSVIRPLTSSAKLEKHYKYPAKIWYKYFKVIGDIEGAEAIITAKLGSSEAKTIIKVGPMKKSIKGKLTGTRGGIFSSIIPDEFDNPTQRTEYSEGKIKIYVKFPSTYKFIKGGFDGVETIEGKILMSELVGEAFCKELARKGIETGKYLKIPGAEIDSFNVAINELQKKYLHLIQEIIFNWKFK